MGAAYRVTQFFQTIYAKPGPQEFALVETHLSPPLFDLFHMMRASDQAHGIRVLRNLIAQDEQHPDLLAAALLHDVGKSRITPKIYERVLMVLAEWLFPATARYWGTGEAKGWRRPFVIAACHPKWGAEMILETGGTQILATLVNRHQETPPESNAEIDQMLHRLQEADNEN